MVQHETLTHCECQILMVFSPGSITDAYLKIIR